MSGTALTPPELARQLRVDVHTVLGWIGNGELRAVNVGTRGKRPRWRIDPADVVVFEQRRAAQPEVKPLRRRAKSGWVFRYF
ncbi:MAG: helix-turn-helix domain-containing protein [Thermoguttaceae bacterium]|jgi:excisionase family DNA binding protein